MRYETPSDLPKLGHRPYVQGGSIFNETLDVCDRSLGPGWLDGAVVTSFKLQRESFGNGRFVVSDAPVDKLEANATFIAECPVHPVFAYYIDEGRDCRCEPYDEESYYLVTQITATVEGEFLFPGGRPRADFIRAVIGANKLLHQKASCFGASLTRIQFLYLQGLEGTCLQRAAEEFRVRIVNLSAQDRGSEVWTINRVAVHGASFNSQFRICYRAVKETR